MHYTNPLLVIFLSFFSYSSLNCQPNDEFPSIENISDFGIVQLCIVTMIMSGEIDSTYMMIDKIFESVGNTMNNEENGFLYHVQGILAKERGKFIEAVQKLKIADSLVNLELEKVIKIIDKEKEELWAKRLKESTKKNSNIYLEAGKPDFTDSYSKLEDLYESNLDIRIDLAHTYRLIKQYGESKKLLYAILNSDLKMDYDLYIDIDLIEEIYLEIARTLKDENKVEEAIQEYNTLLTEENFSFKGKLNAKAELAMLYFGINSFFEAETLLNEAVNNLMVTTVEDYLREFIEIKQNRGIIFTCQGRYDEAEKEFIEVAFILDTMSFIEPNFKTDFYLNFAILYSRINKPVKTIGLLDQVIKSKPDKLKLLIAKICLAEALIKVNDWEGASQMVNNTESNPFFSKLNDFESEKYYRVMGSIHKYNGNFFLSSEYLAKSNNLKDKISSDFTYYSTQSIKHFKLLYQKSETQINNLHHELAIEEELYSKSRMSYSNRILILLLMLSTASFLAVIFYKRFYSKKFQVEELSNLNKNAELEKKSLQKKFIHVEREKILLSKEVEALENIHEVITLDTQEKQKITLKDGTVLLWGKILYVQNEDYNVYIYISGKDKPLIEKNYLNKFEQRLLPPLFFKVHRSFIVNIRQIKNWKIYGKEAILMKNDVRVNVAKGYRATFFSHLEENLDKTKHQL